MLKTRIRSSQAESQLGEWQVGTRLVEKPLTLALFNDVTPVGVISRAGWPAFAGCNGAGGRREY